MTIEDNRKEFDANVLNLRYAHIRKFGYYIDVRGPWPILIKGPKTWTCGTDGQRNIYALLSFAETMLSEVV